jgi:hypothetical protein
MSFASNNAPALHRRGLLAGLQCAVAALLTLAGNAGAQTCGSPLTAALGDTAFTTTGNQTVNLVGLCDVSAISPDILYNATWFRFVAPSAGQYIARTCGTVNFDSKIAVFTDCSNLATVISCNDDTAGCTTTAGQAWASKVTFTATAGGTYYVAVGGFGASTVGGGSLNIAAAANGGNDGGSCSTALTAVNGLNSFNSASSSEDVNLAGLCDPGAYGDDILHRVRWFSYTATATGTVELSTCGIAAFDTRLAVFANCSTTSVIACNDDATGCAGFTSKLQFAAVQGTNYRIAVGGFDLTSAGAGQLQITPNAPPPPTCGTAVGDCCAANSAPFCSDSACCAAVCLEDPYCCSVDGQWDASCATKASLICASCGAGTCVLPASNATEAEPCGGDANGGCNGTTFAAQTVAPGQRIAGTFWANNDTRDTDWYQLTVAAGATLDLKLHSKAPGRIFLVDSNCPPAVIASTDPAAPSCPAALSQCVLPGTYRIIVAPTVFTGFPCTDTVKTKYVLSVDSSPCSARPPSNDDCSSPQAIPGAGGSASFDTRLANNSAGSVDSSCDEGSGTTIVKDVWFSWTPAAGVARVSTCGTAGYDTRLVAYTSCNGYSVGCNDDFAGCDGFTSRMDLPSDGHTTYLIRLGGYDSAGTGTIAFTVLPKAANDECSGAITITAADTPFSTDTATDSDPPLDAVCDEGHGLSFRKDIWFRYVAPCTGQVAVTTCGLAGFDTRLAAYTGCGGTLIACNDDSTGCTGLTSRMAFNASAGTAYLLRVGGHSGGGTGTLRVACGGTGGGGPANETCATATPIHAGANAFDSSLAVSDPPTAPSGGCLGSGFYNDVWFSYVPQHGGTTTISTCAGATFDTRMELWDACPSLGGHVLACNDDFCGNLSAVSANLDCGTTYLVRIGSFSTTGFGTGTVTVAEGSAACSTPCIADLNHDRIVNSADLGLLLGAWGSSGGFGDLDGNSIVDGGDLSILLGAWGPCPP